MAGRGAYTGLKGSRGARKTGTGGRSPYSSTGTGNKGKRAQKRYQAQLGTVQVYK